MYIIYTHILKTICFDLNALTFEYHIYTDIPTLRQCKCISSWVPRPICIFLLSFSSLNIWPLINFRKYYITVTYMFFDNICLCMSRHLAMTILQRTHLSNTSTSMTKTCTMTFNHKVCNGVIRTERRIAWWFKKSQTQCRCHEASLYDSTRRKLLVKLTCWVEHQLQKEHNQSVLYAG